MLTPTTNTTNVSASLSIGANSYIDNAGNNNTAAASSSFAVDTLAPTAIISLSDTALKAGETATVTITFSEAVTGFTTSDITVTGGTISNLTSSDNKNWTATLTPTTNTTNVSASLSIAANSYTDMSGNANALGSSIDFSINTLTAAVTTKTFLTAGQTTQVTDNAKVFGSMGFDVVQVQGSANINANVEKVILSQSFASYQLNMQGTALILTEGNHTINVGLQSDNDGTRFNFNGSEMGIKLIGLGQYEILS
jgi:uncharacterized membrane protein